MNIFLLSLLILHLSTTNTCKKLQEKFSWKFLDYTFNSTANRQNAINTSNYDPLLNIPLGLEIWQDRLFLSVHRLLYSRGIPSTLNYVNTSTSAKSPLLTPYPSWQLNEVSTGNIDSALFMNVDICGRLWLIDYAVITTQSQLLIFDLKSHTLTKRVNLTEHTKSSLITGNIVVDVDDGSSCGKAFAYVTLNAYSIFTNQFDLLVYDLEHDKTWEISRYLFKSESPSFSHYTNEVREKLTLITELGGVALSDKNATTGYRTLYVQPFNNSYIYAISTKTLRNPEDPELADDIFDILGFKGQNTESSYLYLDQKTGILFYDLVTRNAIGCWNSRKYPANFSVNTTAIVASDTKLKFVFNLKGDKSGENLWIATKKERHDQPPYEFDIFYVGIKDLVKGTVCE